MSKIKDIPKGWTIASLVNDLPYIKTGVPEYKGKKKYFSTGSIKLDSIIEEGEYSFSEKPSRANRLAIKGDVLQARMKATDKAILIGAKLDGQLFSTGFFQIRPIDGKLSSSYILHYLTSLKFTQIKDELCSGSTQSALNDEGAKKIFIPIPPFKEQQAIVAKIEELLSELENGKQQLLTAQQQLKVYRQSLLKWAFEGKLTNKKVKDGELPKGWKWVTADDVTTKITDGEHLTPKRIPEGEMLLSAKNVRDGYINYSNFDCISKADFDKCLLRCNPEYGDILIVSVGATIGRASKVKEKRKFALVRSVALLKPNNIDSNFLLYFIQSPQTQKRIQELSQGSAQNCLYINKIKQIEIPLPSPNEQQRIVEELESKLTVCDKIKETIIQSLQQAETLRQSILKKAFEGKLITNKK